MASSVLSRAFLAHRFLQSSSTHFHKPKFFTSIFSKRSFHWLVAPSHLSHKASASVFCSMTSSAVASQASFSMQSLPTNDPVVSVDWLHANLREPSAKDPKVLPPFTIKSTLSNLAFDNVMAAAARDYQKVLGDPDRACSLFKLEIFQELLAHEKGHASSSVNEEFDLDELMDDPELEKLHANRITALKKGAEKRQELKMQGHGEYREINEADFLGEVTGSDKVICHFYHHEFYRCKIMDKHLKSLAPRHFSTKFVKLDAENAPFFVTKLGIKTLPCAILFRKGIAIGRLIGFDDLGGKDDFSTTTLEVLLLKKGIIDQKKGEEEGDDYLDSKRTSVRSNVNLDSDSD